MQIQRPDVTNGIVSQKYYSGTHFCVFRFQKSFAISSDTCKYRAAYKSLIAAKEKSDKKLMGLGLYD